MIRSDGNYVRDYFYVEDGASAYLQLAEQLAGNRDLAGHAFNFSNELQVTVLDLVREITARMGSSLAPKLARPPTRSGYSTFAPEKARRMLGWTPRFSLAEGLDLTIAWYRRFLAA